MLKRELYAALALSGCTLKDWFIRSAETYCGDIRQVGLFEEPLEEDAASSPAAEGHTR